MRICLRSRIAIWNTPSPYVPLEFATLAIRASEGAFALMQNMSPGPTRTRGSVARATPRIMSEKALAEIWPSCLDRGSAPSSWASDAARLSAATELYCRISQAGIWRYATGSARRQF